MLNQNFTFNFLHIKIFFHQILFQHEVNSKIHPIFINIKNQYFIVSNTLQTTNLINHLLLFQSKILFDFDLMRIKFMIDLFFLKRGTIFLFIYYSFTKLYRQNLYYFLNKY
jgi:hypothetical protein